MADETIIIKMLENLHNRINDIDDNAFDNTILQFFEAPHDNLNLSVLVQSYLNDIGISQMIADKLYLQTSISTIINNPSSLVYGGIDANGINVVPTWSWGYGGVWGPQYVINDTFSRSDSASSLGTADSGQVWTPIVGTWGISSNQAYNPSASGASFTTVDSGMVDGKISLTMSVVNGTTGRQSGLVFRLADSVNFYNIQCGGAGTIFLRRQAGVGTILHTDITNIFSSGDVLSVEMIGSTFKVYKNDVILFSITDTTFSTQTKHGMWSYGNAGNRFDDFRIM